MSAPEDDDNMFPNLGDVLSYFPVLRNATGNVNDGFQFIRLPSFNITDHIRNLITGSRGGSSSNYYPSGLPRPKSTSYIPQPPAEGCSINNLPPEILSWIFVLGEEISREEALEEDLNDDEELDLKTIPEDTDKSTADQEALPEEAVVEEGADDDSDWEDEPNSDEESEGDSVTDTDASVYLPFQVLVSHVCQYWRQVSIATPSLWNCVDFAEGKPYEKTQVYLERSKGYPLLVDIDCTDIMDDIDSASESESEPGGPAPAPHMLETMIDMVMPHVNRWAGFHLTADDYTYIHTALTILSKAPPAPRLESLQFYHHEEELDGSAEIFAPTELKTPLVLFSNELPMLRRAAFWGVHIDWVNTNYLKNLTHLELAYHSQDVRPSFEDFFKILRGSPLIESMDLCLSGPSGEPFTWSTILPPPLHNHEDEDPYSPASARVSIDEFLTLDHLTDMTLEFHTPEHVMAILDRLYLPCLYNLSLDFEDHDYSEFVTYLSSPAKHGGSKEPIVATLRSLRLSQLPCSKESATRLLESLKNLEAIRLNFHHLDRFFMDLIRDNSLADGSSSILPSLTSMMITGLDGPDIKSLVKGREEAGFPLITLFVDRESEVEEEEEEWLKEHLQEYKYFEESEDEDVDIDEDDEEDDWL